MNAFFVLLGFSAVHAAGVQSGAQVSENPIRRIVNLLQMMAKEVEADGEKDKDMTEKYVCYCETNLKTLQDSLAALTEEIPQIESSVEGAVSQKAQVEEDLAKAKSDRAAAQEAIESATEQRAKEAKAFDAESTEDKANIAACTKAVAAIEKGLGASFLQSDSAGALRNYVLNNENMDRYTRRMLTDFLSTSQTEEAPGTNEIVGVLKQLLEDMQGELKEVTDTENAAIAEFEGLVAAKEKEIAACTAAIEAKTEKNGELAVKIVNLKNDLSDAQEALGDDQVFLAELKKGCAVAQKEYDERVKMRADETMAISETIKILNDDDALDLFKKTLALPQTGTSLLQMRRDVDIRDDALEKLQDLSDKKHNQVGLIQLALMGKKVSFDKIIKMIDDLVVVLKDEQKADEEQKEWCEAEFEKSDDKKKDLKFKIEGLEAAIGEMTEGVAKLTDEIKALADGITALDKSVAEATATRKEEHEEFVTVSAQNNAAMQLLEVAKNRLNKFYNPTVYKAPERRELTEEERIYVNSGGVDPRDAEEAAAAQTGIAGTGISAFFAQVRATSDVAPPPPPATAAAFKKKDAGGPVALIDKLKNELAMEIKADEFDEKEAQENYEELMADSAAKRAADSKTITEKEAQKAGLEGDLEAGIKNKKAADTEMTQLTEYIASLHGDCDFLLKNFDLRRDSRSSEIDALGKAKAVLSGADFSLLQVKSFLAPK
jgi:septal ring factor EnvC (AmiA/AmiB activator)